ncbi:MAG: branched-chain amino acid ABC transporter substrate-binding protein [Desulfobacterales bacterium]|uniref:Branched-chain amino acid ABC transporter substrate-binding protein n=1 Tax=Candidatus Desulfatibia vada TaxID=2841696 RepID=A0A8J6TJH7_9BACT|nr:branched-chain amino acid ABC transporter substrate-binding protein [Candidatus Desulfatibia vada]MBL6971353.1 branched-chain amino acid ABC transporter substrate-binding protein [Desulfobacterales bacterium]
MKRAGILMLCLVMVVGFHGVALAKTLKIGTLSPLTGPYAQDGTDILQGVKTAVAVFEKAGGVPGYKKIEVVPGDSACDGGKATMAANKLINSEVSGVVGAYCSSATIPASVPLNEANIVQITPASTHTDVTGRGFKQIFRMPPRDDVQAWSTVKFLEDGLKIKTLALIDDRQTYTVGLTENITKFAEEKNKIKIVALEHITPGDKDFTAVLTNLKKLNPDVIYMGVYQPEGSLMVRQAKALGLKSKMLSEDAVFHPKFLEVGGKAAEGTYLTFAKAPESMERKDFEKTYMKMWNVKTIGSYGYYAYDAAMILLEAFKKSGSTDTAKVADTLRGTTWSGVTGEIKFDHKGDRKLAHIIWIVKDGKFVPYWDPLTEKYF